AQLVGRPGSVCQSSLYHRPGALTSSAYHLSLRRVKSKSMSVRVMVKLWMRHVCCAFPRRWRGSSHSVRQVVAV
ncbi:Chitin-inducible gibberellin-responsive protein 2, partial [Frankliniella fusca]